MRNTQRIYLTTSSVRANRGPRRARIWLAGVGKRVCFAFLVPGLLLPLPLLAQTPPARPTISGISHVVVFVADYCGSLPFYSALYKNSAKCSPEDADKPFGMGFFSPSGFIQLVRSRTHQNNAVGEIGFWVSDVSVMRKYLQSQGVDVGSDSGRNLRITDPEGNHIAFLAASSGTNSPSQQLGEPRIIHAGFIVRDRPAMEHFYKDVLGFRPYWHGGMKDDETSWVSLQVPDGTDWIEFMLYDPTGKDKHFLGVMNHIALGVTDIQAAKAQLIKNGIKLTEEPKLGRDGKWQLNVYDPDETRIEFMEFIPKEKPCCSEFTAPHPKP
jgi:catechol 2,3-dioxygenase-like lactoylglutathione lyase family enzyme